MARRGSTRDDAGDPGTRRGGSARTRCAGPRGASGIRARLRDDYEEDGVFRPVRLSVWADWGISALIIVFVAAMFVGFFVWLAQTRVA